VEKGGESGDTALWGRSLLKMEGFKKKKKKLREIWLKIDEN
jgi:hypothetical protein